MQTTHCLLGSSLNNDALYVQLTLNINSQMDIIIVRQGFHWQIEITIK